MDTKAKVNEGDYARGGKNPDRFGRQGGEGLTEQEPMMPALVGQVV